MRYSGFDSPKLKRLARRSGDKPPYALTIGRVELLWYFVYRQAPQGDIGKWFDADIEEAVGWDGEPGGFVDLLVAEAFLDPCPVHRLVVHDLDENATDAHKKMLKRQDARTRGVQEKDGVPCWAKPAVAIPASERPNWRAWLRGDRTVTGQSPVTVRLPGDTGPCQTGPGDTERGGSGGSEPPPAVQPSLLDDPPHRGGGAPAPDGAAIDPKPTTPRAKGPGSRSRSKTTAPDQLTPEQRRALESWCVGHENPEIQVLAPRLADLEEACLDHYRANGKLAADWVATVRNWVRKEPQFGGSGPQGGGPDRNAARRVREASARAGALKLLDGGSA